MTTWPAPIHRSSDSPDLDRYAATCRAIGIQLLTIWQDLAQIQERYGPRRAATILNNHRGVIALPGIKDPTTLDYLSTLAGQHDAQHTSSTISPDNRSAAMTTTTSRQNLAEKAALRSLKHGFAVTIYGALPMVYLNKSRIYKRGTL